MKALYLEAIQSIAGKTPGEKHKTIHLIAREVASVSGAVFDYQALDFPEPLKPLLYVEVTKITHQREGIIDAFKCEDFSVVYRALQAKWFFTGSDKTSIDAKHMVNNVFPEISLHTRYKIIQRFGTYLRNVELGAELFTAVSQKYGIKEAIPLLVACDEQFAFDIIVERKIKLSMRMIKKLYAKYPNLVIKYLMLTTSSPDQVRDPCKICILDYLDFLPYLAKKHFNDFMVLYDTHNQPDLQLKKKSAKMFIGKCMNLLIEHPKKYLKLIPLKLMSKKVSFDDFSKIFEDSFPENKDDFCFTKSYESLRYYISDETEKVNFILALFRKVYGQDLLESPKFITPELLRLLPVKERAEQARLKLAADLPWHVWDYEHSWRCYLPISESITLIKTEMARSSDSSRRMELLNHLVYACKINNDKDAILDILNYVYDRHRHEGKWFLNDFLTLIQKSFNLSSLTADHWAVIDKYMKLAKMQDKLTDYSNPLVEIIEDAFLYCFSNDLPIDDYLEIYIKIALELWYQRWNVLKSYPKWERKCLDLFIITIPKQCPLDNEFWTVDQSIQTTSHLVSSLYDFNQRICKSNRKSEKLSIRDYPWLCDKIKELVFDDWEEEPGKLTSLLDVLRKNEKDLLNLWLQDVDKFWNLDTSIILYILPQQAQRILDHWTECFDRLQHIDEGLSEIANKFFTKCRWYHDLPIKCFEAAWENYQANHKILSAVETLAIILDGSTFTEIIAPVIPKSEELDIYGDNAQDMYTLLLAIASNLRRINPPVALDVIGSFCTGDYLQMAMRAITQMCRRAPIKTVIYFAKSLMNRRVSVMKHGIRVMYMVAPLEELYAFLINIWEMHAHMSIRAVLLKKIYDLFFKQLDIKSWDLLRTSIENLNTNDDYQILNILIAMHKIPNEYVYDYLKIVHDVLKNLVKNSQVPDNERYLQLFCKLIDNIDLPLLDILPEEYSQQLIKIYLFDFNYNAVIFKAGKGLARRYLASKVYNDARFNFFANYFRDTVKKYWDKSDAKCSKFYPVNFMIHEFLNNLAIDRTLKCDPKIFESLLEIFQSVLSPHQDIIVFVNLVYCIEFYRSQTPQEFSFRISQKILYLIDILTSELIMFLGLQFKDFLKSTSFNDISEDESRMIIMEGLLANGNIYCAMIVAILLRDCKMQTVDERHKNIVSAIRRFNYPALTGILYTHINTFESVPY